MDFETLVTAKSSMAIRTNSNPISNNDRSNKKNTGATMANSIAVAPE
nr:hypothetical protein [Roseibium sp.]